MDLWLYINNSNNNTWKLKVNLYQKRVIPKVLLFVAKEKL